MLKKILHAMPRAESFKKIKLYYECLEYNRNVDYYFGTTLSKFFRSQLLT